MSCSSIVQCLGCCVFPFSIFSEALIAPCSTLDPLPDDFISPMWYLAPDSTVSYFDFDHLRDLINYFFVSSLVYSPCRPPVLSDSATQPSAPLLPAAALCPLASQRSGPPVSVVRRSQASAATLLHGDFTGSTSHPLRLSLPIQQRLLQKQDQHLYLHLCPLLTTERNTISGC